MEPEITKTHVTQKIKNTSSLYDSLVPYTLKYLHWYIFAACKRTAEYVAIWFMSRWLAQGDSLVEATPEAAAAAAVAYGSSMFQLYV